MEERLICCCGARGWTLVIGWFQIIGTAFMLLGMGVGGTMVMSEISSSREVSFVIILVLLVILLLLTILTLYMAVMLIRGSNNKNPRQINIWIIYAKILLVIYAVGSVIGLFFITTGKNPEKFFTICVNVGIQCFFVWVVEIHKKEIEDSEKALVA